MKPFFLKRLSSEQKFNWEIMFLFAKEINIQPSETKKLSLSQIGYYIKLLLERREQEEREMRKLG